jgi:hypothetical protein
MPLSNGLLGFAIKPKAKAIFFHGLHVVIIHSEERVTLTEMHIFRRYITITTFQNPKLSSDILSTTLGV